MEVPGHIIGYIKRPFIVGRPGRVEDVRPDFVSVDLKLGIAQAADEALGTIFGISNFPGAGSSADPLPFQSAQKRPQLNLAGLLNGLGRLPAPQ
jgi:hypothetical protein